MLITLWVDIMCVCPSVHSLSPSLLPSVPLIPECVTNGRSRCSAVLHSASGDPSSVCVRACACVCMSASHWGFRSCEKGAVQDAVLQKGREGMEAVGRRYPPLAACSWASPGHRNPMLPQDLRSLFASLYLPSFSLSFFSLSLVKSISWQRIYCISLCTLDGGSLQDHHGTVVCACVYVYLFSTYKNGFACLPVFVCLCFEPLAQQLPT